MLQDRVDLQDQEVTKEVEDRVDLQDHKDQLDHQDIKDLKDQLDQLDPIVRHLVFRPDIIVFLLVILDWVKLCIQMMQH